MSPSEEKGLALGLRLLRFDKAKRTTMIEGRPVKTQVFAEFESPPLLGGRIYPGTDAAGRTRRHVLHSFSKSRAGAWRHAIRWLRQLQKGKL